mmetsp:Transcript_79402/g.256678  ORF Transcript_79402/g.256678 Transcript_79402/m.256678 type:complete len:216 (+) Transcript_79402:1528-2175(+)
MRRLGSWGWRRLEDSGVQEDTLQALERRRHTSAPPPQLALPVCPTKPQVEPKIGWLHYLEPQIRLSPIQFLLRRIVLLLLLLLPMIIVMFILVCLIRLVDVVHVIRICIAILLFLLPLPILIARVEDHKLPVEHLVVLVTHPRQHRPWWATQRHIGLHCAPALRRRQQRDTALPQASGAVGGEDGLRAKVLLIQCARHLAGPTSKRGPRLTVLFV